MKRSVIVLLIAVALTVLQKAPRVTAADPPPAKNAPAPAPQQEPPVRLVPPNPNNYPPLDMPGIQFPKLPGSPTVVPSFPPLGNPGGGVIWRFPL
jgi:hypothetical protein